MIEHEKNSGLNTSREIHSNDSSFRISVVEIAREREKKRAVQVSRKSTNSIDMIELEEKTFSSQREESIVQHFPQIFAGAGEIVVIQRVDQILQIIGQFQFATVDT